MSILKHSAEPIIPATRAPSPGSSRWRPLRSPAWLSNPTPSPPCCRAAPACCRRKQGAQERGAFCFEGSRVRRGADFLTDFGGRLPPRRAVVRPVATRAQLFDVLGLWGVPGPSRQRRHVWPRPEISDFRGRPAKVRRYRSRKCVRTGSAGRSPLRGKGHERVRRGRATRRLDRLRRMFVSGQCSHERI
jgi:hypothetical protein